ncbi:hypothetical protein [Mycolicibacterium sphagni]|nr:hypothetical protein [Mycolicibacterium sphagni]
MSTGNRWGRALLAAAFVVARKFVDAMVGWSGQEILSAAGFAKP